MHAVRLLHTGQPLVDAEVEIPTPGNDDVVVEVRAAGICHSDAHYRSGRGNVALPLTMGHEVAGVVAARGRDVKGLQPGDRVAIHYLLSCGRCLGCLRDGEQFCESGAMIGKDRDGGYAEAIVVPASNAVPIPENVPFEQAAIMMCSTATAWHAIRLAQVGSGASVAIIGFGGLGVSAVQLLQFLGAVPIAIDVVPAKLEAARLAGAEAVAATAGLAEELRRATGGRGVDVALDLAGHPGTCTQVLRAMAPGGRLVLVAINLGPFEFDPYRDILARERRIIGCSDHLRAELVELMEMAASAQIDLGSAVSRQVPLQAAAINGVLDDLDRGSSHFRAVIIS